MITLAMVALLQFKRCQGLGATCVIFNIFGHSACCVIFHKFSQAHMWATIYPRHSEKGVKVWCLWCFVQWCLLQSERLWPQQIIQRQQMQQRRRSLQLPLLPPRPMRSRQQSQQLLLRCLRLTQLRQQSLQLLQRIPLLLHSLLPTLL